MLAAPMCFAPDARPPDLPADLALPPLGGGAAAELLELTSADGARFSAALASSGRAGGAGVVVLPDIRGLSPFYVELAERFADAGHHAIALDLVRPHRRARACAARASTTCPTCWQTRVEPGAGRRDRGPGRRYAARTGADERRRSSGSASAGCRPS